MLCLAAMMAISDELDEISHLMPVNNKDLGVSICRDFYWFVTSLE